MDQPEDPTSIDPDQDLDQPLKTENQDLYIQVIQSTGETLGTTTKFPLPTISTESTRSSVII